ncbi:ectopic P granules protein 5-like protein, partial [Leptotrombidium deliense]
MFTVIYHIHQFDVNSWLKIVADRESTQFLQMLGNALFSFGKNPNDEKQMVLGLYRKHLQYMAICRFPDYLEQVFRIILNGMRNFSLYPLLWNDLLLSFGFYVQLPNVQLPYLIAELKKYANSQPLFCANE